MIQAYCMDDYQTRHLHSLLKSLLMVAKPLKIKSHLIVCSAFILYVVYIVHFDISCTDICRTEECMDGFQHLLHLAS